MLQPIILAFLGFILLLWISLPGGLRKRGLDEAQAARESGTPLSQLDPVKLGIETIRRKLGVGSSQALT